MSIDLTAGATNAAPKTAAKAAPRVLPEDGIVDPIAIEIAVSGSRPVDLTHTERVLAAAQILAAGGGASTIAARLYVSGSTARALAHQARKAGAPGDVRAA
ncbi:DNA-binding CsgD family transcriptional regulator [Actinomadura coerulea]|uniref:DNA-binding CsgD family transcriptional regulator n=1 Tax=Actinomadura coerulea TaxID=46159 RepID=A0A7X0FTS1_9ACTN|nr:hypothetical protein [Actinomadura coerulea]MBB6393530.1 DNA-binding CsgD family transcriptional regulator [Actinomadura coerulea]GGP92223.1 hypothetical protein GCM10010187_04570 [Actinomadura coerulea]